ncbi:MAG: 50S ribosomal protein L5 [archaeon]
MENSKKTQENPMRTIRIAEIVLNCGALGEKLERSIKLLKMISGKEPIITKGKKRLPAFGIRPGLPTGCKVTVKGAAAIVLLKRLLDAVSNQIPEKQICNGQLSFGIPEYIEIPGVQFLREIGILGLDVSINLVRAGSRIEQRKSKPGHVPLRHRITKQETKEFMQRTFDIKIMEKKNERK